ncbi:MAG: diguanylate cyclase [Rectinemataceae bacterium]
MRLIVTSLLFSCCIAVLFMSVLAMRKRSVSGPSSVFLTLCCLCVAIYAFGYAMEINGTETGQVFFWVRFEHFGIQPLPAFWLMFTMCIMGRRKAVTPRSAALLLLPALIFFIASQTLGGRNLMHPNARLASGDAFSLFLYDRGWVIYLVTIFQSLYLAASSALCILGFVRGIPVPKSQAAIYCVGSFLPWLSSLAYNFGLVPYNADPTPIVLSISIGLFAVGFLKIGILDIAPLARDVIFENTPDGALVVDRQGRITDSNLSMRSILPGLDGAEMGVPAREMLAGRSALIDILNSEPPGDIEFLVDTKSDSRVFHVTSAALNSRSGKDQGKLLTFHDVTEMKDLQLRLEYMAAHDDLTGLYNRRYLDDAAFREVEHVKRYGGNFSLIMLDLDHFKFVNDTYGHAAGDAALVAVANACRASLRICDIVGRFGGEEILILLPEAALDASLVVAEKLRAAIEALSVRYEGKDIRLTASFGVADMNAKRTTYKDLLIAADRALYRAKEAGRNCLCECRDG